jgi:hypothetical protein
VPPTQKLEIVYPIPATFSFPLFSHSPPVHPLSLVADRDQREILMSASIPMLNMTSSCLLLIPWKKCTCGQGKLHHVFSIFTYISPIILSKSGALGLSERYRGVQVALFSERSGFDGKEAAAGSLAKTKPCTSCV